MGNDKKRGRNRESVKGNERKDRGERQLTRKDERTSTKK